MCPGPSNCVPNWPISVATKSSWYTIAFRPKGPPVGVPGMLSRHARAPKAGISEA